MKVRFVCEPALKEYLKRKNMTSIAVEVVSSNSDFEITELHTHAVRPAQAAEFRARKGFRSAMAEEVEILLPPYRLEYDDEVVFSLRKLWIFHSIKTDGIRL